MNDEALRKLADVGLALLTNKTYFVCLDYEFCILCGVDYAQPEQHANDCPIPEALEAYEELKKDG